MPPRWIRIGLRWTRDPRGAEVHATDAEGSPITFHKVSGPAYMGVTTTSGGPGTASGMVRLTPDYVSAGTAVGVVGASDGVSSGEASFGITVTNVPRAPILAPVNDMTAEAGGLVELQIVADDPDNEGPLIQFSIASGPPWVSVTRDVVTLQRVTGTIRVNPSPSVTSGAYPVILLASKPTGADSAMFTVTVTGGGCEPCPALECRTSHRRGTYCSRSSALSIPTYTLSFTKTAGPASYASRNRVRWAQ